MPASEVMGKWKRGELHSGSKKGPVVKSQKQAVAIMLSEKRKGLAEGGDVEQSKKSGVRTPYLSPESKQLRDPFYKPPPSPAVKVKPDGTIDIPDDTPTGQKKGGPVMKKALRKGGHVDKDEVSGRAAFAQNVAETLANPTGRTGLAKGGTVEGHGWRRWGQGGRHPHG